MATEDDDQNEINFEKGRKHTPTMYRKRSNSSFRLRRVLRPPHPLLSLYQTIKGSKILTPAVDGVTSQENAACLEIVHRAETSLRNVMVQFDLEQVNDAWESR